MSSVEFGENVGSTGIEAYPSVGIIEPPLGVSPTFGQELPSIEFQTHTLLDGDLHSDTISNLIARGDLIYVGNASRWDALTIGAADTHLSSDGTDVSWVSDTNWNTAYSHSQLISGNPHLVTYAELGGTHPAPISHTLLSHTISGETLGYVLAADSATTYSIRQLLGSEINNDLGWDTVTPAALTRTNDTNVTLTLGGTPTTALLQAISLALGWTGTLADSRITSAATWNSKQNGHANLTSLSGLSYVSASFVKMTAANTLSLDTNTYSQTGHVHSWSDITSGVPTTLSGYGISDTKSNFDTSLSDGTFIFEGDYTTLGGYSISDTKTNFDTALSDGNFMYIGDAPTSHTLLSHTISGETLGHVLAADSATTYSIRALLFSELASTPTTLAGYGITDALEFDGTPDADTSVEGVTMNITVTGTTVVGTALYATTTSNTLGLADADAATAMPCIALAAETNTGTNVIKVLLLGVARNDALWAFGMGADIFVSTNPGGLTSTAPSGSGDQVQKVGVALEADAIYFNPSMNQIEV